MQVVALLQLAISAGPDISFVALIPSGVLFGLGIGFGSSQLTNVVLSHIPEGKVGVASGTHSTMRQAGQAIGIATFTAVIFSFTIRDATAAFRTATLSEPVREASLATVRCADCWAPSSSARRACSRPAGDWCGCLPCRS